MCSRHLTWPVARPTLLNFEFQARCHAYTCQLDSLHTRKTHRLCSPYPSPLKPRGERVTECRLRDANHKSFRR
jgi:hypothetical protein